MRRNTLLRRIFLGHVRIVRSQRKALPRRVLLASCFVFCVNRDRSELDDGYYHYEDLYLCDVYYLDNKIGQVIDMINQTAHITLRIKRDGKKDLLYPFVERFIKSVDVENKRIDLNPIEGMID